jgi:hypothetical protein
MIPKVSKRVSKFKGFVKVNSAITVIVAENVSC